MDSCDSEPKDEDPTSRGITVHSRLPSKEARFNLTYEMANL